MMIGNNLAYKLWANAQRNNLAACTNKGGFLSSIDLSNVEKIFFPDQSKILDKFVILTKHKKPKTQREFIGNREAAISFFSTILKNLRENTDYYILIGTLDRKSFGDNTFLTSELPFLIMNRNLAIACWEKYSSDIKNDDLSILVISSEWRFLAVIDCCTGFYADGGSPDRVIYEVSLF
jgi:hypothetical protein